MLSLFLFFLLLLSFLLVLLKRHRLVLATTGLSLLIFVAVGSGVVPNLLLRGLQIHPYLANPGWKSKNVIILLCGGAVKWEDSDRMQTHSLATVRTQEALRLYQNCKEKAAVCSILVSGGDPAGHGKAEAAIMKNELIELGISADAIQIETKSLNTYQNARFSSEILRHAGYDQVVLVTSATHMSRALMMFLHFGIEAMASPADQLMISQNWKYLYQNFHLTELALHEFAGQLKFLVSK